MTYPHYQRKFCLRNLDLMIILILIYDSPRSLSYKRNAHRQGKDCQIVIGSKSLLHRSPRPEHKADAYEGNR